MPVKEIAQIGAAIGRKIWLAEKIARPGALPKPNFDTDVLVIPTKYPSTPAVGDD
jgi:hypothetical protein